MKEIYIPQAAKNIIERLMRAGHEAYIVGGCVRDALLGKEADDYDITTSAFPEEVKAIFEKTVDTGISHGTVTVISDGIPYEVTTFRIDGEYRDSRHPVSVSFTKKVELDQARRDFTVNAMCYNDNIGIVDTFGGMADIENKIIRAVGDAEKRFEEDALRVFRAIRFSAVLGFEIEEKTDKAVAAYKNSLSNISSERIYVEWKKLLGGKFAYSILKKYKDVIAVSFPELSEMNIPDRVKFDRLNAEERQIVLFAANSTSEAFDSAMRRLKVDNKTREFGVSVLNNLALCDSMTDGELKIYLQNISDAGAICAATVLWALGKCSESICKRIKKLIELDTPRRISHLKVGGRDLISAGLSGEDIGRMLSELLRLVALGKLENDKEHLMRYVFENK